MSQGLTVIITNMIYKIYLFIYFEIKNYLFLFFKQYTLVTKKKDYLEVENDNIFIQNLERKKEIC